MPLKQCLNTAPCSVIRPMSDPESQFPPIFNKEPASSGESLKILIPGHTKASVVQEVKHCITSPRTDSGKDRKTKIQMKLTRLFHFSVIPSAHTWSTLPLATARCSVSKTKNLSLKEMGWFPQMTAWAMGTLADEGLAKMILAFASTCDILQKVKTLS